MNNIERFNLIWRDWPGPKQTFTQTDYDDFQGEPCFICGTHHSDEQSIKDCQEWQKQLALERNAWLHKKSVN